METINAAYSTPYVCFVLFLLVLMFAEFNFINHGRNRDRSILLIIGLVGFTLFIGLKGFVGYDTLIYYDYYREDVPTLLQLPTYDNTKFYEFEPGFAIITCLCKTIGLNFWGFNFLNIATDAILLYFIIKRESPYYLMALIIYLAFRGYQLEVEQIRNAKGILLFMLSLRYTREGRFLPYLILNLIGTLFHSTSYNFIAIYPILRYEVSLKLRLLIFFGILGIFFFRVQYLSFILEKLYIYGNQHIANKVEAYLDSTISTQLYGFGLLNLQNIVFYIVFCLAPSTFGYKKHDNVLINLQIFQFISIFAFCEINVLPNRLCQLFIASYIFLIPQWIEQINQKLLREAVILSVVVIFMPIKTIRSTSVIYFEYSTCFTATESLYDKKLKESKVFFDDIYKKNEDNNRSQGVKYNDIDKMKKRKRDKGLEQTDNKNKSKWN